MKIIKIDSIACTSCILMNSVFDKVKEKYNFELEEYDFDEDYELIEEYNVKTLPTFIFYNNNQEVKRIVGENKIDKFEEILEGCEKN